jgi:hypothetical protein
MVHLRSLDPVGARSCKEKIRVTPSIVDNGIGTPVNRSPTAPQYCSERFAALARVWSGDGHRRAIDALAKVKLKPLRRRFPAARKHLAERAPSLPPAAIHCTTLRTTVNSPSGVTSAPRPAQRGRHLLPSAIRPPFRRALVAGLLATSTIDTRARVTTSRSDGRPNARPAAAPRSPRAGDRQVPQAYCRHMNELPSAG